MKNDTKMSDYHKGILINGIVRCLNEKITEDNKKLCKENLHNQQKTLHGFSMIVTMHSFIDSKIEEIAKLCGL